MDDFFPAVVVLGFGMTITVAPLTTNVIDAVLQERAGIASGINNAVARTAGLLSIAVLSLVILAAFSQSLDRRLATLNLPSGVREALAAQWIRLAAAEIPPNINSELIVALKQAIAFAFVDCFRIVIAIAVVLALGSAIVAKVTLMRQ